MGVDEHTIEIAGASVFYRRAPAPQTEVLYLHSAPTSSDDWQAPLALSGGVAPDLPGFGRTGKPGSLTYTIGEYDRFIERFIDELEVERVSLLVHDWGGGARCCLTATCGCTAGRRPPLPRRGRVPVCRGRCSCAPIRPRRS